MRPIGLTGIACALALVTTQARAQPVRPWSLEDSITYSRYVGQKDDGWRWGGNKVTYSSSGRRLFVMTDAGDLDCDCNVNRLSIFDARAIEAALERNANVPPEPTARLEFRTTSHHFLAVAGAYWVDEGLLAFLGAQPGKTRQLYTYDVDTRSLTARSHLPTGNDELNPRILQFEASRQGALFVSVSGKPRPPPLYPLSLVDTVDVSELGVGRNLDSTYTLHVVSATGQEHAIELPDRPLLSSPSSMQPARSRIVAFAGSAAVPARWAGYDRSSEYRSDAQFQLASFESLGLMPIVDAPLGTVTKMGLAAATRAHSPLPPDILYAGSEHALLVNAALPLSAAEPARAGASYVLGYSMRTGKVSAIELLSRLGEDLLSVSLREGGRCLVTVWATRDAEVKRFRRRVGERWTRATHCAQSGVDAPIAVTVEEGANDPPRLVATRRARRLVLIDRDSSLEDVAFASVQPFHWTESDGRQSIGGLTVPVERPSGPLPLVILVYHYEPDYFFPDGVFPSFSAQSLAAAGMAVLQMKIPAVDREESTATPMEGPAMVARVDAAVAALAARGIVDRTRVGMIGFSRGGYMARYVATFPGEVRLAAAIADDAYDAGYLTYLVYSNWLPDAAEETSRAHGGKPFWADKSGWLKDSLSFNLDKLKTPLLVASHDGAQGPGHFAMATLEAGAAAAVIDAPIQLVRYPLAGHQPIRPRERRALMELHRDWMRFWLTGAEDPASPNAQAYSRWRDMKRRLHRP